jgi:hypothetical protein
MAYFIFLKSLRSLAEFRKNPHVKIPPKSPCANFQSLCIFKNQKFYSEIILLIFRTIRPFGPAEAHSFFSIGRFSLPSPLGLGLPADPAHHHGPTGHRSSSSSCTEAKQGAATGRPHAASTVAPTPPPEEKNGRI